MEFNSCTDINSDYLWCSRNKDYDGTSVPCSNAEEEQRLKRDNYYKLFNILKDQEEKIKQMESGNNGTNSTRCLNCEQEINSFITSVRVATNIASDHMRKIMAVKQEFIEKQRYADALLKKVKEINDNALRANRRRTEEFWDGTAPFCKGSCPDGQTAVRRDSSGDGKTCWTGSKVLCRRVYFL